MSDYIIICRNLDVASRLGNRFIATLKGTGEFQSATEGGRTVYTNYGDRYYFTNMTGCDRLLQGRHDAEVHTDTLFASALDNFHPEEVEEEVEQEVDLTTGIPWIDQNDVKRILERGAKPNGPKNKNRIQKHPSRRIT